METAQYEILIHTGEERPMSFVETGFTHRNFRDNTRLDQPRSRAVEGIHTVAAGRVRPSTDYKGRHEDTNGKRKRRKNKSKQYKVKAHFEEGARGVVENNNMPRESEPLPFSSCPGTESAKPVAGGKALVRKDSCASAAYDEIVNVKQLQTIASADSVGGWHAGICYATKRRVSYRLLPSRCRDEE